MDDEPRQKGWAARNVRLVFPIGAMVGVAAGAFGMLWAADATAAEKIQTVSERTQVHEQRLYHIDRDLEQQRMDSKEDRQRVEDCIEKLHGKIDYTRETISAQLREIRKELSK